MDLEVEPSFQDHHSELTRLRDECRTLRNQARAQQLVRLEGPIRFLLSTLPPKTQCDALLQAYLRTFEPMYRILNVPLFMEKYEQIWKDYEVTDKAPQCFLMTLVLALALGSTFYKAESEADRDAMRCLTQSWIQNAQWWLSVQAERKMHTLDALQACCLLMLCRQATYNCSGMAVWLSTGSLLNMAVSMGLHRDPAMFTSLNKLQRETRKRLWATALELTVQSTFDLAAPMHFGEDDYDTPLPENFNDDDLCNDNEEDAGNCSDTVTDSSLQILLAKSLRLRLRILRYLHSFHTKQTHEATLRMSDELRAECRDLAAFWRSLDQKESHTNKSAHRLEMTDFHRVMIDIHVRRFMVALHRPFMLDAAQNPQLFISRKLCVDSATIILSYSKRLRLNQSDEQDDLSLVCLAGRGIWIGPFSVESILILTMELATEIQADTAHGCAGDALDELSRASRAPITGLLEAVKEKLYEMIKHGTTSLKRYLFLVAYLAQTRAMEQGTPLQPAMHDALVTAMRQCIEAVRLIVDRGPLDASGSGVAEEVTPEDIFPMDFSLSVSEMFEPFNSDGKNAN